MTGISRPEGMPGGWRRRRGAARGPGSAVARRTARREVIRRRRVTALVGIASVAILVVLLLRLSGGSAPSTSRRRAGAVSVPGLPFTSRSGVGMRPGPNLAPGSNPSVLPGDVLIADEGNNRLLVVNPAGTLPTSRSGRSTRSATTSRPAGGPVRTVCSR